jgi:hypothetical protein
MEQRLQAATDALQMHGLSLAQREHYMDVPTWLGTAQALLVVLGVPFAQQNPFSSSFFPPQRRNKQSIAS